MQRAEQQSNKISFITPAEECGEISDSGFNETQKRLFDNILDFEKPVDVLFF